MEGLPKLSAQRVKCPRKRRGLGLTLLFCPGGNSTGEGKRKTLRLVYTENRQGSPPHHSDSFFF
jgi:hypothetical protein